CAVSCTVFTLVGMAFSYEGDVTAFVAAFVVLPTRNCAQRGDGGGGWCVTPRHALSSVRTASLVATAVTAMTSAVQASFFILQRSCSRRAATVARNPFGSALVP